MKKTILITGASSGIGAACVKQAASKDLNIIATARSKNTLLQLQKQYANVQIIVADIATDTGRNMIADAIKQPVDYLLHNAAILDSPQGLAEISLSDFRNHIVTNVEPIIFLTQKLIHHLSSSENSARILSVSSGAAKQAIAGIGNYCISKAAALMANEVLKVELQKYAVLVNDYFPGVVDTNMQKTLRTAKTSTFPYASEFNSLKQQGRLSAPLNVAAHIIDVFINSDETAFSQTEWKYHQ
ncbi:MAG: SDR family NAD(P)-dependent oxidoreductase [Alcanivoracaceae bacterium]|nr:SDR family NAD(P)-dependent oxidoreductase [Alcanivoracaceae bacterium]